MKNHAELARNNFLKGYNCAQSVAIAFSEEMGMDETELAKLASSFGGGFGKMREICGAGTLTIWGDLAFKNLNPGPVTMAILPAGGFITLGLLLALINRLGEWNARRHGAPAPLPVNLDCRHCTMCGKRG